MITSVLVPLFVAVMMNMSRTHGCQIAIQAYTRGCDCAEDVRILNHLEDMELGDETAIQPLFALDDRGQEVVRVYILLSHTPIWCSDEPAASYFELLEAFHDAEFNGTASSS
jgi:hypothetical protein